MGFGWLKILTLGVKTLPIPSAKSFGAKLNDWYFIMIDWDNNG